MSRGPRLLIDNVIYHVINRGNQKQIIFYDEEDYQKFLDLLWKYKNKYTIKVYAYCLMNNHVHLVLEPNNNKIFLQKMMHGLNMSYAMWFNNKHKKCGHLWQDRYKSYVLEKDKYIINCITYVESNPARNNYSKIEEYPWSSYSTRVFGKKNRMLDKLIF